MSFLIKAREKKINLEFRHTGLNWAFLKEQNNRMFYDSVSHVPSIFSRILKEKHIKGIHCLLYSNNSIKTRSKLHNKAASSCIQKRVVYQLLFPEELTLLSVLSFES